MDKNILSLNSQYDEFTLRLDKAKRLLNIEKIEEAKTILLGIISENLYHIEANDLLSRIYEFEENYDMAAKALERLLYSVDSLSLRYKLAQVYQDSDDYYSAYRILKELCEEVDGDKNLYEQMAHTCAILDKTNEAIEYYDKVLKIDKDNLPALSELADIYYDTDKVNYYFLKSRIYVLENNNSYAIDALRCVLKLLDDDMQKSKVHLKIARLYHKMGRYDKSYDEYLKVLEYNPSDEEAKEEIDKIFDEKNLENRSFVDKVLRMLFN